MKISFLRAKRIALVSLLKAEKHRQQEREAEAKFYSDEICPTKRALDAGCSHAYSHGSQPADYIFCPWCGVEHQRQ